MALVDNACKTWVGSYFATIMSISSSLYKAVKLQEKIEALRKQLTELLNKARQELASNPTPEIPAALRRAGHRGGNIAKAIKTAKPNKVKVTRRGADRPVKAEPALAPVAKAGRKAKGRGRSSLAGRKRASSPGGPLAPAVVKVLQSNGKPMRVADILDGLFKNGYRFSSPEPKKNLAARIYRLSGVKQVAEGLFAQV